MGERTVLFRLDDGRERLLPVYLDTWVLVPRALAHEQCELAWTLESHDAPERMLEEALDEVDADPAEFVDGALLVRLEDWHDRLDLAAGWAMRECRDTTVIPVAAASVTPQRAEQRGWTLGLSSSLDQGRSVFAAPYGSPRARRPTASWVDWILPVSLLACYVLAIAFYAAVVVSFLLTLRLSVGLDEWFGGVLLTVLGWAITRFVAAVVYDPRLVVPFAFLTLAIPIALLAS